MSSPLTILLALPEGRRGMVLALTSTAARAVGIVFIAEALVRTILDLGPVPVWIVLGLFGAVLRGASLWADQVLGTRHAAEAKRGLRARILDSLLRRAGRPRVKSAVTVTRGIDDLDDYFTTVVPALCQAAVIPAVLLIRILFADVVSAVIIVLCLPLVPIFMILIGRYTQETTQASTRALERLSDHLAELAEGLPVLIGLGRSREHAATLRRLSDDYHAASLSTLRIAFLSSLALELIATISVALVAVVIGLRLVGGTMDLSSGLLALLLAPECFMPLRALGAGFHASENGRESYARAQALIAEEEVAGSGEASSAAAVGEPAGSARSQDPGHRVVYPDGTTVAWTDAVPRTPGITAVLGPSGAGKTTVLSALTGTLPAGARATTAPLRAALVPQSPRAFGVTIGDELATFGLEAGEAESALFAAALPADPTIPTAALSPGQLRRLALVRLRERLRTEAELLVLDEPTAHLDDDNAQMIIAMIAEAARTTRVVLASHDPRVLALAETTISPLVTRPADADSADLSPSAEVAAGAATTDAMATAGVTATADAMAAADVTATADVTAAADGMAAAGAESAANARFGGPSDARHRAGADGLSGSGATTTLTATAASDPAPAEPTPALGHNTPAPEATSPRSSVRGSLGQRWATLRTALPLFTGTMAIALLTACAASLAAISLTAVSAWLIVEASYGPPIMTLLVAIVGVRFFGLCRSVLQYVSRLKLHSAIFAALGRLRASLWSHFERAGMSDRTMLTSDSALRTMVADADEVRDLVPRTLFPPVVSALVAFAVLIAAALIDPASVPVIAVLAALNLIIVPLLLVRAESPLAGQTHQGRARILSLLTRALSAKDDLRANGADAAVRDTLAEAEARLESAQLSSARRFGLAQTWIEASTVGAAILLAVTSSAPTELLAVVVLITFGLTDVFASSLTAWRQMPGLGIALDRLPLTDSDLAADESAFTGGPGTDDSAGPTTSATPTDPTPTAPTPTDPTPTNPTLTTSAGERHPALTALDLRGISAGWEDVRVLDDLDLTADASRWTVVCGDSGSGKTTTVSVLLRFLTPWQGTYVAEEAGGGRIDMLDLTAPDLAGRIAWCPQEAHVFRSTVRGNLALARRGITEEEMVEALRSAGLAHWANTDGLDRWVGDHGTDISGGERQRLAVARTLLSGAEVVILDEPTAHLDAPTGYRLIDDLRDNLGEGAVIMVTHDESLIDPGDRVERLSPASIRT